MSGSIVLFSHRRLSPKVPQICCMHCYCVTNSVYSSTRFFSSNSEDHYRTLGIKRDATNTEIKQAYFELSKRHHPDMNPDAKEKAAASFQKVTEAYEVLGSKEKRKIYDSFTARTFAAPRVSQTKPYNLHKRKDWTDLDIDYRDFEHFQNINRRKRVFRTASDTSDSWTASKESANYYKDERVLKRERLERQLHEELEARRQKDEHPIPTFEQLLLMEEARKREERRQWFKTSLITIPIFLIGVYLVMPNR